MRLGFLKSKDTKKWQCSAFLYKFFAMGNKQILRAAFPDCAQYVNSFRVDVWRVGGALLFVVEEKAQAHQTGNNTVNLLCLLALDGFAVLEAVEI